MAENTHGSGAKKKELEIEVWQYATNPAVRKPDREHSQDVSVMIEAVDLKCADSICFEGQNVTWPVCTQVGRLSSWMVCRWTLLTNLEPFLNAKHCRRPMGDLSLL